jgi:hypothetical protein
MGKDGNPKAMIYWLKHRCPSEWGDKQQPSDTIRWPDTLEEWTAKREEFEKKYREWITIHAVSLGSETATPESVPTQGGGTNGSKPTPLAKPETEIPELVTPMSSSRNGNGVHGDNTCRVGLDGRSFNSSGDRGRIP